jgi:hypothetical protein
MDLRFLAASACLAISVGGGCQCSKDDDGKKDERPTVLGLDVSDERARSCEVVLADPDRAVADVGFGAAVQGKVVREGARIAASFLSRSDARIAAGQVTLVLVDGASSDSVQVQVSQCFNGAGEQISGAVAQIAR